jgi:hypothetical protein
VSCRSIERFRNLFLYQYLLLYFLAHPLMPDIFEFLLNVLPHCHLGTVLKLVLHFHCCPQTVPSSHVVEIPYLTFLLVTYLLFCLSISCARQHLCLQQQTLCTERTFKIILMPCIFSVPDIHEIWLAVLQLVVVAVNFFLQCYNSIYFSQVQQIGHLF